ncbi:MAG: glycosyltransferase family 4 protein [Coriobacteriia bacterium]|nr:glycosyltransferase family 4 protein [Coriobacteriia bacterium]
MATIGIDVTALSASASGGIGTSQYRIMQALAEIETPHRFLMYAAKPPMIPFTNEPLDLPWELRLGLGLTTRSNILWMQTGVNRLLAEDGVDLFWSPRHLLPLRAGRMAMVASIQDFWHRYYPGQQPWLNRTLNRELFRRVIARADRIVAISNATAEDVVRFHGIPRERVDVVHLGVDTEMFHPMPAAARSATLADCGIERPYVLSLDVFNPRKNFSAVLKAVALMSLGEREGFEVVGIGRRRKTATQDDPIALAEELGLQHSVCILDDVRQEDLVALYSGALALVYPSVYEGFGMPVLEAMACGCPVVTSDRSSLPEVAGASALLVDPDSAEEIAGTLRRLTTDAELRAQLSAAGAARAAAFSWRKTAEGMLASFEHALLQHNRTGAL